MEEARLAAAESGLTPQTEGWFVVNARDAAWVANGVFGVRCPFEASQPVIRGRAELHPQTFAELGLTLAVLDPGQASGLYHAETEQEDFLVLAGECVLLVEGEERPLGAWDLVHCPPGTAHAFVGTGERACVLLMVGRRSPGRGLVYPSAEVARRHGAGVEAETTSPAEAYAPYPHWRPRHGGAPPF